MSSARWNLACIAARLVYVVNFVSLTLCTAPDSNCNVTLTDPFGEILSPNYPGRYPRGVVCLWTVSVSSEYDGIVLQFKYFVTKETNRVSSSEEALFVYTENPESDDPHPERVLRGRQVRNLEYRTQSTQLWLTFQASASTTSDGSGTSDRENDGKSLGFDIIYSVSSSDECQHPGIPEHGTVIGTNFTVGSSIQFFCSRGYRILGVNHLICILRSENGQPEWSDAVPPCVNTCPSPSVPGYVRFIGNMTLNSTITFTCDPPYLLQGLSNSTCTTAQNGVLQWDHVPSCYIPNCSRPVILYHSNGSIVNPSYPRHIVLGAKNCRWRIFGKPNTIIRLYFVYFDLAADEQSYLEIKDTGRPSARVMARFQGRDEVRNLSSWSNLVEIIYRGPQQTSTTHQGFYISYTTQSVQPVVELEDDPHGPTLSPGSTSSTETSIEPASSTTHVIRHPDTGTDTVRIAVGVSVPVVIGLIVVLGLYLWYRKKYPVRMIVGREFAKFSNPEYQVKNSTISLVREDADEYFSPKNGVTNLTLVSEMQPSGPQYDNMAFQPESEESPSLSKEEEEEEEDRKLMLRKSYLFKHRDSVFPGVKSSLSDSDSSISSPSQTQVRVEQHDVTDSKPPTAENQSVKSKSTEKKSSSESSESSVSSDTGVEKKKEKVHIVEKDVDDVLEEMKHGRRAMTMDERPVRRYSIDPSLSVRGRSKSIAPTSEFGLLDTSNPELKQPVRARSKSIDVLVEIDHKTIVTNITQAKKNEAINIETVPEEQSVGKSRESSSSDEDIDLKHSLKDKHKGSTSSSDSRGVESSISSEQPCEEHIVDMTFAPVSHAEQNVTNVECGEPKVNTRDQLNNTSCDKVISSSTDSIIVEPSTPLAGQISNDKIELDIIVHETPPNVDAKLQEEQALYDHSMNKEDINHTKGDVSTPIESVPNISRDVRTTDTHILSKEEITGNTDIKTKEPSDDIDNEHKNNVLNTKGINRQDPQTTEVKDNVQGENVYITERKNERGLIRSRSSSSSSNFSSCSTEELKIDKNLAKKDGAPKSENTLIHEQKPVIDTEELSKNERLKVSITTKSSVMDDSLNSDKDVPAQQSLNLSESRELAVDDKTQVSSLSNSNHSINNEDNSSLSNQFIIDDYVSADLIPIETTPSKDCPIMVTDLDDCLSLSSLDASLDASSNSSYSPSLEKRTLGVSEPRNQGFQKKVLTPKLDLLDSTTDEYSSSDDDDNHAHVGQFSGVRGKSVLLNAGVLQLPEIMEEVDSEHERQNSDKEQTSLTKDGVKKSGLELTGPAFRGHESFDSRSGDSDSSTDDEIKITEEDILKALESDESDSDTDKTHTSTGKQNVLPIVKGVISDKYVFGDENDDIDV